MTWEILSSLVREEFSQHIFFGIAPSSPFTAVGRMFKGYHLVVPLTQ